MNYINEQYNSLCSLNGGSSSFLCCMPGPGTAAAGHCLIPEIMTLCKHHEPVEEKRNLREKNGKMSKVN